MASVENSNVTSMDQHSQSDQTGQGRWGAGIPVGCVLAMLSAAATCTMLVINGVIVMAFLRSLARSGADWARDPRLMQFLLLLVPVVMVVLQWMVLDYLRNMWYRLRGRGHQ